MREGRVGVWVERKGPGWSREDKIAAIGVKLRKWVSFHGISLNVEPDLEHFTGIVPCGQTEHGVTSLVDLGLPVTMDEADEALRASFTRVFGAVEDAPSPLAGEGVSEADGEVAVYLSTIIGIIHGLFPVFLKIYLSTISSNSRLMPSSVLSTMLLYLSERLSVSPRTKSSGVAITPLDIT